MEQAGLRKIELSLPDDLTYLLNTARETAATLLAEAFPQTATQPDDLQQGVENLVYEYIAQTFALAAPNISINGLDVDTRQYPMLNGKAEKNVKEIISKEEERYEPYDAEKRQQAEDLSREAEELMAGIAALKRTVAKDAAEAYAVAFDKGVVIDEAGMEKERQRIDAMFAASADGSSKTKKLHVAPLERQDDVERNLEETFRALSRLKKNMPATVAKMERARVAGEYVVTER